MRSNPYAAVCQAAPYRTTTQAGWVHYYGEDGIVQRMTWSEDRPYRVPGWHEWMPAPPCYAICRWCRNVLQVVEWERAS